MTVMVLLLSAVIEVIPGGYTKELFGKSSKNHARLLLYRERIASLSVMTLKRYSFTSVAIDMLAYYVKR